MVAKPDGKSDIIPILGTIVFGSQRMLPLLQQIYSSWSAIQANLASMEDVVEILEREIPKPEASDQNKLPFAQYFRLKNVYFQYEGSKTRVLEDINIQVPKGKKVGFVGRTGAGKSTLLDIVMTASPYNGKPRSRQYKDRKEILDPGKILFHMCPSQFFYLIPQ